MKYNEEVILKEAVEYIQSTYKEHYAADDEEDFQLIDLWAARGTAISTSLDTVEKYALRFGKKGGYNQKDLFKAIHYICFAIHFSRKKGLIPKTFPEKLKKRK